MIKEELNEREKTILRYIIQQFILTAAPVGSKNISEQYNVGLSSASIRNIMADLEESGYINHPHTSAGRVPTDKGYRFYVDSLIEIQKLKNSEKGLINKNFENTYNETEELIKLTSNLLSNITKQLACVTYPKLDTGIFEKLQIVILTTTRILVVITIKSGLVKTITLELTAGINSSQVESIQSLLNERLSGLTFKEIRETFEERFKDLGQDHSAVIRFFVDSADKIFKDIKSHENLVITGAKNIVRQPEFEDPERFQGVIELIEDKDIIIHILEKNSEQDSNQVYISIGSENENKRLTEYSFISKDYQLGGVSGTLGIIGPKRMEYAKIIAIVDYIAKMLSEVIKNEKQ